MDHKMRRFKQQLSEQETREILLAGRECVMALCDADGTPYAVPVNYVYDGERIYIHSAKAGHKVDALRACPSVSLCVVAQGDIVPQEYTTYFRSAIVFGTARFIDDEAEMTAALRKLCDKYSPGMDASDEISRLIKAVAIIEIEITRMTGKESIELTRQR